MHFKPDKCLRILSSFPPEVAVVRSIVAQRVYTQTGFCPVPFMCSYIYASLYLCRAILIWSYNSLRVSRFGYYFEIIIRVRSDSVICLRDLTRCYPLLIYPRLFQRRLLPSNWTLLRRSRLVRCPRRPSETDLATGFSTISGRSVGRLEDAFETDGVSCVIVSCHYNLNVRKPYYVLAECDRIDRELQRKRERERAAKDEDDRRRRKRKTRLKTRERRLWNMERPRTSREE